MRKPKAKTGFTLLELLVVIAIISILASLLYPIITTVLRKSKITQCQNNLRNIGLGLNMYAQAYNDVYPNTAPSGNTGSALGLLFPEFTDDPEIFKCRGHAGANPLIDADGLLKGGSYCYASYGGHANMRSKLEIAGDRDLKGLESNHLFISANVLYAGMSVAEVRDSDKSDASFDMKDGDDLSLEDDIGDSDAQDTTDGFLGAAE